MKTPKVSRVLFILIVSYLILVFLAVLLVDFLNVFDLQSLMEDRVDTAPLIWFVLFQEEGVTEILQYASNTGTILLAGTMLGVMLVKKDVHWRAFLLFGVAVGLLLLEDTGNLRHSLRGFVTGVFGVEERLTSWLGIGVEVGLYALFGVLMLLSVYKLRRVLFAYPKAFKWLIAGYVLYGAGAMLSASRHMFGWYTQVGTALVDRLDVMHMDVWQIAEAYAQDTFGHPIGFFLLDFPMEESIELLGASVIFISTLTLFILLKRNDYTYETTD